MAIVPEFSSAAIDEAKLSGYLFNPDHIEGWPKGRFLVGAGFNPNDYQFISEALRQQAISAETVTNQTLYGTRYECDGAIFGPSGESRFVRTVWQLDLNASVVRFITLKPLRKSDEHQRT